jgi:hypothetical protein
MFTTLNPVTTSLPAYRFFAVTVSLASPGTCLFAKNLKPIAAAKKNRA